MDQLCNVTKPRPILIKLCSMYAKRNILRNSKNLKDSDVFINENLTAKNGLIAQQARQMKRQGRIEATWVRNGAVFIKCSASDKSVVVKSVDALSKI